LEKGIKREIKQQQREEAKANAAMAKIAAASRLREDAKRAAKRKANADKKKRARHNQAMRAFRGSGANGLKQLSAKHTAERQSRRTRARAVKAADAEAAEFWAELAGL
jgi:hypothetical protein